MSTVRPTTPRQRGIVLSIVLIFLTILLVLGMAGIHSSQLQMQLAQNAQLRQRSLHDAESALAIGETAWTRAVHQCLRQSTNCELDPFPPQVDDDSDAVWQDAHGAHPQQTPPYGRYYVEFLGVRRFPGDTQKHQLVYRVTAMSVTVDAPATVQSLFGVCVNWDGLPCNPDPS